MIGNENLEKPTVAKKTPLWLWIMSIWPHKGGLWQSWEIVWKSTLLHILGSQDTGLTLESID